MARPVPVAPGDHELVCRQGAGGVATQRKVTVKAGRVAEVIGLLRKRVLVRLRLSRGDAVRIAGGIYRREVALPPSRYRVDLLRSGKVVGGGWLTVSAGGCTLVDTPRLDCR